MEHKIDESMDILARYVAGMMEHFDSVQVFVTRKDGTDTASFMKGAGNWYARYGQVRAWLMAEDARTRAEATCGYDDDDDDEDDDDDGGDA